MLLLFSLWPKSTLVIEAEGYDPVFLESDTFELHWIHSIENEEWFEIYEIQDNQMLLTKTYFKTFGAGVPAQSEEPVEITDDGFVGLTINETYPGLYMNVSENVETKIVQDDNDYLLYEMFETNTSVEIKVVEKPLFVHLTEV